jgi:hypothetical protein
VIWCDKNVMHKMASNILQIQKEVCPCVFYYMAVLNEIPIYYNLMNFSGSSDGTRL